MITWHTRYKRMKQELGLTNSDLAEIVGNTPDSIKSATQPNKDIPRWLKLAIVIHEGKWVKCTDQPPPINTKVLICIEKTKNGKLKRSWEKAWVKYADRPKFFGIVDGNRIDVPIGIYFELRNYVFVLPQFVTHWMIEPTLPFKLAEK